MESCAPSHLERLRYIEIHADETGFDALVGELVHDRGVGRQMSGSRDITAFFDFRRAYPQLDIDIMHDFAN